MQTSTLSLATSNSAEPTRSFVLPSHPSLPSLLGFGLKGPLQLFGLRKTPGLSNAPRQALKALFEHERAQIQQRAVGDRTARSHILADFWRTHDPQEPKTIACRETSGDSGGNSVVTRVRSTTYQVHTRPRGATGIRRFPTPSYWAEDSINGSGAIAREGP